MKTVLFCSVFKKIWSTLIVSVSFRSSTLQRVSVLKTLLNFVLSYILPPLFLHYFPRDKFKLSHYAEVRPGLDLVQNHLSFGGLRPSRFILVPPEAGKLRSLIIPCSLLEKTKRLNRVKCAFKSVKRLKFTAINKEAT